MLKHDQTPYTQTRHGRLAMESEVFQVRLPFGGLVWRRPSAVLVESAGGRTQRVPIHDVTRWAQIAIAVASIAAAAALRRK